MANKIHNAGFKRAVIKKTGKRKNPQVCPSEITNCCRKLYLSGKAGNSMSITELQIGMATYLMREYPSHLEHEWGKVSATNENKNREIYSFLCKRRRYVKATNGIYIIEGLLYAPQLYILFMRSLTGTHSWWMFVLKLLGFVFCFLSMNAWLKQLWKDEEYYGQALANYSVDEPIDRTLKKLFYRKDFSREQADEKTDPTHNDIVITVSDWLKNRPSVTFLLVVTICCYRLDYVFRCLDFPWLVSRIPCSSLRSFLFQLVVGLIFYFFHTPFITRSGSRYSVIKKGKKEFLFVNRITITLWFVLFFLPAAVTFLLNPEILPCILKPAFSFLNHQLLPRLQSLSGIRVAPALSIILVLVALVLSVVFVPFLRRSIRDVFFSGKRTDKNEKDEAKKNSDDKMRSGLKIFVTVILAVLIVSAIIILSLTSVAAFHAPDELAGVYDRLCVLSLLGIGITVYLFLFWLSSKDKYDTEKKDNKIIDSLKKTLSEGNGQQGDIEPKTFKMLSPNGQMKVLTMIQNHDISIGSDYLVVLSGLADSAHTPLALDTILDIYRSHKYYKAGSGASSDDEQQAHSSTGRRRRPVRFLS